MTLRRARQREPGRHLAYCLPFPPPDSKLFGDYESTFLQPNSPTDYPSTAPLRYSVIGEARIMIGGLSAPLLRCLFPRWGGEEGGFIKRGFD